MEVWRGMAEGLKVVIVNPSVIIGPGDWKRSSTYLFTAVWNGMKFYTKGITGYVDIRDVIYAMVNLMEGDFLSERYTVSSENLSYQQLLEMIAAALHKRPPRIHASPFLISIAWRLIWLISIFHDKPRTITRDTVKSSKRKAVFSNEKIRKALDMEFIPVNRSIQETAVHFLNQVKPRSI